MQTTQQRMQQLAVQMKQAFTEHPHAAGESYWEHLGFTVSMAGRFALATTVLVLHGLFPFTLERAASRQTERIYSIMKTRIPKARRDQIDLDYSV